MWLLFWPVLWFSPTRIRQARMVDAHRLTAIHAEGFATGWDQITFEAMLRDRSHLADCLISQGILGEIVTGFAISRIVLDEAELLTIAIDQEARGRGLARGLLLEHASRLRKAGATRLFLEVAADNMPALALYRGLGFIEIGRRKNYYPAHHRTKARDALTMEWDLSRFDPTPRPYT